VNYFSDFIFSKKLYFCNPKYITIAIIMSTYNNIIRINPEKRFGKPCVRDTRITVFDVLGWLSAGMTYDEILADFPELTKQDILSCLTYAAQRERTLQYIVDEAVV
jgi:uncharacterized protein (DUF433 family)